MSKDPDSFKVKLAVLGILVAGFIFFYPSLQRDSLQEKLDELQNQYDEMQAELQGINEDILYQLGNLEEDMAVVYMYFDQDEDITFDEARKSFNNIDSVIDNILSIPESW